MSLPTGSEVDAQARSSGTGGSAATPSSVPPPCPSGDVPKEGSRDIQQKGKIISVPHDWSKATYHSAAGSHFLGHQVIPCIGMEALVSTREGDLDTPSSQRSSRNPPHAPARMHFRACHKTVIPSS